MDNFREQMSHYMRYGITVNELKETLDDLINDGYGEYVVGFRIGHTVENLAINFPIINPMISEEGHGVFFSPAAPVKEFKDRLIPEFDIVASICGDNMQLKFEEIIFA